MNVVDEVSLATERNAVWNQVKYENGWYIINGERIITGKRAPVVDAENANQAALVPDVERALLPIAVNAARIAFSEWGAVRFARRKAILGKLLQILVDRTDELARLLSAEQDVGLAEAKWEINLLTKAFGLVLMQMEMGENDQNVQAVKHITKRYVPLGPAGAVRPANLPIIISFGKVFPALLAGDTLVLRPPPSAPHTVLRISEYLCELLPPGVFNVVPGGLDFWPEMAPNPGIDLITFTMSRTKEKLGLPYLADTAEFGTINSSRFTHPGRNTPLGSVVVLPIVRKAGRCGLAGMLFDILSFQPKRMKTQVLVWSLARKASYGYPIFRRDS
jgi:delta 1-pyrroline-5-carboxylate dehydrogenase